uniref:Conotoxin n=2 Tax=Conus betulinus TaxID=89764 RepID=A0A142C1K0_CONBE|nr:conotoxin [Conus betulinus]
MRVLLFLALAVLLTSFTETEGGLVSELFKNPKAKRQSCVTCGGKNCCAPKTCNGSTCYSGR